MDYDDVLGEDRPAYRNVKRSTCEVCGKDRLIPGDWQRRVCVSCRDHDPILKRCSKCKLHKKHPAKGWTDYYCPDCSAEASRLFREKLKQAGKTTLKIAVCTTCGIESECPQGRTCRPCRNTYQRQWREAHPETKPVYARLGKEPMRKCSHCKQRLVYAEKYGWRGGVCGRCNDGYRKKALANRQAQTAEWRETGAMITCTRCGEASSYGTGWSIKVCPACVSIHSKAQAVKVAADPERLAHRRAMRNEARRRRESAQGGDSAPPSPAGDE